MRTVMLIAVGLALTVGAAPSMAQKKNSALYPWERKGDQLVRDPQRDPMAKILEQDRKILKILGLPSNKMSTGGETAPSANVGLDLYNILDGNRDGSISREEYMARRYRAGRAGAAPGCRLSPRSRSSGFSRYAHPVR